MLHTSWRRQAIPGRPSPAPAVEALEARQFLSGAPAAEALQESQPTIRSIEPRANARRPDHRRSVRSAASPASQPLRARPAALTARYVKRVGDDLVGWASTDGSGSPVFAIPLPFAGDAVFEGTPADDTFTIDMIGGDIVIEGALVLNGGGGGTDRIRLINGDGRVLTVGGVTLNGNHLDLGTGNLRVVGGDIYAVEALVGSARNNGVVRWQGPGIGTSSATASTGLAPLRRGSDVVVMYSWVADFNGDARINADDYFIIDWNFLVKTPNPLFEHGDVNFDDKIDGDDYFIIDQIRDPWWPVDPPL